MKLKDFGYQNGYVTVSVECDAGVALQLLQHLGEWAPGAVAETPPANVKRQPAVKAAPANPAATLAPEATAQAAGSPVERVSTPPRVEQPAVTASHPVVTPPPTVAAVVAPQVAAAPLTNGVAMTGVDPVLVAATSFRQVMNWMLAKGFKDVDTIVVQCEALKAGVPTIQRLGGDLRDRVKRSLEVIQAGA